MLRAAMQLLHGKLKLIIALLAIAQILLRRAALTCQAVAAHNLGAVPQSDLVTGGCGADRPHVRQA